MAFQRGEIVLILFPFTNLTATKTRPAVIVSGELYHRHRSELLMAYVSSQMAKVNPLLDYSLADWKIAGLPKPSFVRPKIAAIEASLVVHQVGKLSPRDLAEVDRCIRRAMALHETAFPDWVNETDWMKQPVELIQTVAEKAIGTLVKRKETGGTIERLKVLMNS